ncbi:MAG: hypothetical protein EB141_04595 [Verrucomicrobia bacterium]|nr:hypothetical protein [Verrucomicrobiota bacterium]NBU09400.1 hypothetical protein [Pseudomonadota bacterium]NDA66638.1 hypothetical protein [Verrucomicrobiota bacterium]NDB74915.1 hypothetical protein [Verrucomicrobiota bacterium]NDD37537.1 hypothetical protein [Verrucomicrobiota bacterium]
MNVDPAAQFSMGELIGRAVGLTCLGAFLGLLLAALPHAVWQGCGLLRLRRGAKRKFSFGLALIALGTATLIGAATGFTVGVARAALVVAREIGPKVFQTSAENTLRAAGVKDFTSFDPARLRELLEQAGKAELPALPGELAQRLRPEMELSRAKLLEQAKAWLDTQSKDGPLAVGEVVATFWPKVLAELVTWERHFRVAAITHGVLWILGLEIILALLCALSRALRSPIETEAATPPKLV